MKLQSAVGRRCALMIFWSVHTEGGTLSYVHGLTPNVISAKAEIQENIRPSFTFQP